jgi:hypothetical protein
MPAGSKIRSSAAHLGSVGAVGRAPVIEVRADRVALQGNRRVRNAYRSCSDRTRVCCMPVDMRPERRSRLSPEDDMFELRLRRRDRFIVAGLIWIALLIVALNLFSRVVLDEYYIRLTANSSLYFTRGKTQLTSDLTPHAGIDTSDLRGGVMMVDGVVGYAVSAKSIVGLTVQSGQRRWFVADLAPDGTVSEMHEASYDPRILEARASSPALKRPTWADADVSQFARGSAALLLCWLAAGLWLFSWAWRGAGRQRGASGSAS